MRVGLLETHAARLPGYWAAFLKELGSEPVLPDLDDTEALTLGRESLPHEPLAVQLALGRILSMGRVDAVLLAQWPAVSGDAWSEALPDLLARRISGLPTLIGVPDSPEGLEGAATELGLRVSQNAGRVRLALEKVRPLAQDPRAAPPALTRASRATVAVIGPRALLSEPLVAAPLRAALDELGLYGVFSHELPVADVLKRAERLEQPRATAGDRELFGATSLLGGKGAVKGFVFVSSARDGSAATALGRLAERQHKPTLLLSVDGQTDFPELAAFRDRVTPGSAARPAPGELDSAEGEGT